MITVAENDETYHAFVRNTLRLASRAPAESLTQDEYDLMKLRQQRGPRSGRKGQRVGPPVAQIFARADSNQDGKLSEEEAKGNLPPRNFRMCDANKDGFVTQQEMIATRKRLGIDADGYRSGRPSRPQRKDNGETKPGQEEDLKAKLERLAEEAKLHGSVAVAKDGEILFARGYLAADHRKQLNNQPDTRHRIGSITKQFTAMGILIMEEQHKLKVADRIGQHLSDLPKSWQALTIHQLLSHTSGLMHSWSLPAFKQPADQKLGLDGTVALFHDQPLLFEPGTDFRYSGVGYFLLAQLIEKLSGQSYEAFLKQQIFDPLDMNATGAGNPSENRSIGYERDESGNMRALPEFPMTRLTGGGNLYSTVEDLIRWDNALRAGKLISPAGYEKLYRPEKKDYAYGWKIRQQNGRTAISHGGGVPGFTAYLLRYPKAGICVAVLTNTRSRGLGKLAENLATAAAGR